MRARGFTVPAAGKTGTSHDGWFAGFTSELLCVVWVGFDDNRMLNLEGAHSALPIWTEFMKRALQSREYRDAKPFEAPDGVVSVTVDSQTGMPATPFCPETRSEVFIAGTQPVGTCPLHGGGRGATYATSWDAPAGQTAPVAAIAGAVDPAPHKSRQPAAVGSNTPPASDADQASKSGKKRGIFRRLLDVFK